MMVEADRRDYVVTEEASKWAKSKSVPWEALWR